MDKFYVKPKRSLKAGAAASSTLASSVVGAVSRKSAAEVYPATANARATGVGKFYSKIRHTIEDNLTPKISGKLYKGGKHSKSMTALSSLESSMGKYTLTSKCSDTLESKPTAKQGPSLTTCETSGSSISNYFTQKASGAYVDSDEDEAQLSLNLVKTSLEDEIFEELEKVAHDEHKLNAVLKTFDKIMFDYNDPLPQTKASDSGKDQELSVEMVVNKTNEGEAEARAFAADEGKQANTLSSMAKDPPEGSEINQFSEQLQAVESSQQTDCRHETEWRTANNRKLEKSSSSLSLTRRKCYQSPDSPCLRQMKHVFVQQQQRLRSKSVWELSNSTKIPILKAMPLQKRSKSFCYQSQNTEVVAKQEKPREMDAATAKTSLERSKTGPAAKKMMTRTSKYVNIKPSNDSKGLKSKQTATSIASNPLKVRQEPKSKTRSGDTQVMQPRRTNSNASLTAKTRAAASQSPPVPPRRSKTSDELLDKCLEKGQQILRKVESLKTQQRSPTTGNRKPVVRLKSNGGNKISKEATNTLRRKKLQQKLNYANEDKISPPSLESCRIIPPDFAEHTKRNAALLVNVVHLTNVTRSSITPKRQMSADSGIATNACNSLDFMPPKASAATPTDHESDDSDDSGHISNENMEVTINHQPSSASSTNSLSGIDQQASASNCPAKSMQLASDEPDSVMPRKPQRVCTTCRIAQVESVRLIRTHVEIYPNFTKEVTIRLH
ncbi:uncharacterized protein LOC106081579 [Stomoxys calcitrans]|uniref:uncharacterized protein LOC106081579 n=1 Tax=Stomoxys calcitrans TaxID=35570 RepID=UPI0027E363E9|nr:uncharacterized protein LOC106081579 [Stomoxys calcitrans]